MRSGIDVHVLGTPARLFGKEILIPIELFCGRVT
jgi:hypothetical protein